MKDLELQISYLLAKTKDLKAHMVRKDDKLQESRWKTNKVVEVIGKIREYIGHPSNIINKTKLYDNDLMKLEPISGAKVINVLVDYSSKIDKNLDKMRILVASMKPTLAS